MLKQREHNFIHATKTRKNVHHLFVTPHGMVENQWYFELVQHHLTTEDLFERTYKPQKKKK
jgi:hypothetical protein